MDEGLKHEPPALKIAGDALRDNIRNIDGDLAHLDTLNIPFEIPYKLSVPNRAAIGRTSDEGIAYLCLGASKDGREIRGIFDKLAEELGQRMR